MKKIVNGGYTMYYTGRLFLACNAPIKVPVHFDDNNAMTLVFDIGYDGGETSVSFAPSENNKDIELVFAVKNFGTPFGTVLKEPVTIGRYGKGDIKIRFGVTKPQDSLPILDLSVYVEGKSDE